MLENKISLNRHHHHHHHHKLGSHSSLDDLWPKLGGLAAWVRGRYRLPLTSPPGAKENS